MHPDDQATVNTPAMLSREEIESACMLSVLAEKEVTVDRLTAALGFAPGLVTVVGRALELLVSKGWVDRRESGVVATSAGRAWLTDRLAHVGINPKGRSN